MNGDVGAIAPELEGLKGEVTTKGVGCIFDRRPSRGGIANGID